MIESTTAGFVPAERGNLMRRVAKNSFLMTASNLVLRCGDLAIVVIATRLLETKDYAIFMLALSFYGLFKLAGDAGLQHLLVRDIAQDRENAAHLFRDSMLFETLWSLVLVAAYILAVLLLGYDQVSAIGLYIALLALIPDCLSVPALSAIQAFERLELLVVANTIGSVLRVVLSLLALLLGYGLMGVLLGLASSRIINFLVVQVFASRLIGTWVSGIRLRNVVQMAKRLAPFFGITLVSSYFLRADVIILSRLASEEAVAVFGTGNRLMEPVSLLLGSFALGIYPTLSASYSQKDGKMALLYSGSFRVMMLAMFLLVTIGDVLAKPLIDLLFPAKYLSSVPVMQVFLWYMFFFGMDQLNCRALLAMGKQTSNLGTISAGSVLVTVLAVIFAPKWGAVGVAFASMISMAFVAARNLWVTAKSIPEAKPHCLLIRLMVATIIVKLVSIASCSLQWGFRLGITFVATICVVCVFGLFRLSDLAVVHSIVGRRCFARRSIA